MSSRNATREDFDWVICCIKNGLVNANNYSTYRVKFKQVKDNCENWLNPSNVLRQWLNYKNSV